MANNENKEKTIDEIMRQRYLKVSPFNAINGNYQFTACVGTNGGYNQSTIYEGFKDAVNAMLKSIDRYENFSDPFVYPILFCIRHSIELFLKDLLSHIRYLKSIKENRADFLKLSKAARVKANITHLCDGCDHKIKWLDEKDDNTQIESLKRRKNLLESRSILVQNLIDSLSEKVFVNLEKGEFTHDLNELIAKIIEIYDVDERIKALFDEVLPILQFYKDIDPNGDAFRYWFDKDGNPHFETKRIRTIKLDIVAIQFDEITNIFNNVDWLMWLLGKEYNTGTFTKDLSRKQLYDISKSLPSKNEFNEKIKEVKEKIKIKYNISSRKFDEALEIIRKHREFSSYTEAEIEFSSLSGDTMKIFAECSLNLRDWDESSKYISSDELSLLYVFSDISGWRYSGGDFAYFSEELDFLYSYTKKNRRINKYDLKPAVEIDYVLKGMDKCGQVTYASFIREYISNLKLINNKRKLN